MEGNCDTDAADLEVWLQQALSTKRRKHRASSSPYSYVPTLGPCGQPAGERHSRVSLKATSNITNATQPPASKNANLRQHGSIPSIATPSSGRSAATPPETRIRGVVAMKQGGRRQGVGSSRSSKRPATAEAVQRMSAAELAAKKLILPFIDELSFIEISLAERGNPSGVGLAPSNTVAKDAMELFQASYLFTEGLDSLGKETGQASSRPHQSSIGKTVSASWDQHGSSNSSTRIGSARTTGTSYSQMEGSNNPGKAIVPSSSTHRPSMGKTTVASSSIHSSSMGSVDRLGEASRGPSSPHSASISSARTTGTTYRQMEGLDSVGWGSLHSSSPHSVSNASVRPYSSSDKECAPRVPAKRFCGGFQDDGRTKSKGGRAGSITSALIGGARRKPDSPDIGSVLRRFVATRSEDVVDTIP